MIKMDKKTTLTVYEEIYISMQGILKKLQEYEELEEKGLLLQLPCRVGDTLVFLTKEEAKKWLEENQNGV